MCCKKLIRRARSGCSPGCSLMNWLNRPKLPLCSGARYISALLPKMRRFQVSLRDLSSLKPISLCVIRFFTVIFIHTISCPYFLSHLHWIIRDLKSKIYQKIESNINSMRGKCQALPLYQMVRWCGNRFQSCWKTSGSSGKLINIEMSRHPNWSCRQ